MKKNLFIVTLYQLLFFIITTVFFSNFSLIKADELTGSVVQDDPETVDVPLLQYQQVNVDSYANSVAYEGGCVFNLEDGSCQDPQDCLNKSFTVKDAIIGGEAVENTTMYCIALNNKLSSDSSIVGLNGLLLTGPGIVVGCKDSKVTNYLEIYDDYVKFLKERGVYSTVCTPLNEANVFDYDRFNSPFGNTQTKVDVTLEETGAINPVGLVYQFSTFTFYIASFIFVILIMINGISYIRSKENPSELAKIKTSLFNTISGYLFIILIGGLIINIITQIVLS
jgi:hypothetical protein